MNNKYGAYQQFYVKKKSLLFPLIEKYSGLKIDGKTSHETALKAYFDLLKSNKGFVAELDQVMANANFKNAVGILDLIGGGINAYTTQKEAELESDKFFYESVLAAQKKDDTKKLLIVSGISLVVIGLTVFLVIKYKK